MEKEKNMLIYLAIVVMRNLKIGKSNNLETFFISKKFLNSFVSTISKKTCENNSPHKEKSPLKEKLSPQKNDNSESISMKKELDRSNVNSKIDEIPKVKQLDNEVNDDGTMSTESDYDPTKKNYHPINDAFWSQNQA